MKPIFAFLVLFSLGASAQVTPEQFGAKGDGITNDGPALEKAFAAGQGKTIVLKGRYLTDRYLVINADNTTVLADTVNGFINPLPSLPEKQQGIIRTQAQVIFSDRPEAIKISRGQRTFVSTNSADLREGYIVIISGNSEHKIYPQAGYKFGVYDMIEKIEGNTITLANTPQEDFTAQSISLIKPVRNVHIEGVRMDLEGRKTVFGIAAEDCVGCSITKSAIKGVSKDVGAGNKQGIRYNGVNGYVAFNSVMYMNPQYYPGSTYKHNTGGTAYAYAFSGANIIVEYNTGYENHAGLVSGSRKYETVGLIYRYNNLDAGTGSAHTYDMHGNSSGRIHHNIARYKKGWSGITIRNSDTRVDHNTIYWDNTTPSNGVVIFVFEQADRNIQVDSNAILIEGGTPDFNNAFGMSSAIAYPVQHVKVFGNRISGGNIQSNATITGTLLIENNELLATAANPYPHIALTNDTLVNYVIRSNRLQNFKAAGFSYLIRTPKAKSKGVIEDNIFDIKYPTQKHPQIRVYADSLTIRNNRFKGSKPGNYIINVSRVAKCLVLSNNVRIATIPKNKPFLAPNL